MSPRVRALSLLLPMLVLCGLSALTRPAPEGPWRAIGAVDPRISPDGNSLAFSYQGAIWRLPRGGGVMRRLSAGPGFAVEPAWSADGREIAFVDLLRGAVSRVPAEGGPARAFPGPPATGRIEFHPSGRRLLGNFRTKGAAVALGWLDVETGEVVPALEPPRRAAVFALSPDGARIAFATSLDAAGEQQGSEGPRMDVWIAADGKPEKLTRFPSRLFGLCWAGEELVAVSDVGGAHDDLWSIPLGDPQRPRKLTFGQADENAPSVSADGRRLAYADNRGNATALIVRDRDGGEETAVQVTGLDFGVPAGTVALKVVDKSGGAPLVARVSMRSADGLFAAPPGSTYRLSGDQMYFYCDREARFAVPAGRIHLHATRGPEYRAAHLEAEVEPGRTTELRVELERWTDPTARGWYDGENHIHANYGYGAWYHTPETIRPQIEGEGLRVANLVVANSDTDGIFDREFFRGRPDPLSTPEHVLYWNEEFRATLWGHMTLLNLRHLVEPLMTGFKDTTNPWDVPTNADVADHVHLQGGHVNYTHPAANARDPYLGAYSGKSLPVDVALGKIDSIDINWGWEPTVSLWHRFLNCGFRLPASAGTDCFLNRLRGRLPGADRVYVKVDGPFSYEAWMRGLKAGRSFVTDGLLLELAAGGKQPGDTIVLAQAGSVDVHVEASAPAAVDRVELVFNGTVVAQGPSPLRRPLELDRSGWLGARAFAGRLQAHTSPVYVEVAGRPAASKADAEYFLAWIDRLDAQLRARDRVPSAELKARVEAQLDAAREVYRRVLDRAD